MVMRKELGAQRQAFPVKMLLRVAMACVEEEEGMGKAAYTPFFPWPLDDVVDLPGWDRHRFALSAFLGLNASLQMAATEARRRSTGTGGLAVRCWAERRGAALTNSTTTTTTG